MIKNKLKFIGRGSAFNINEINTSAYYKEDNQIFIIDCGESVFSQIIKDNILEGVTNVVIFITHSHSDHIGSLSTLIYYCYYMLNIKVKIIDSNNSNITGYLTNTTSNSCYELVDPFEFVNYWNGNSFNIVIISIQHDPDLFSDSILLVFNNGNNIYYSGDCSSINKYIYRQYLIREPDTIIYQEASINTSPVHCNIRYLENIISDNIKDNVYLMHLDGEEKDYNTKFKFVKVENKI